MPAGSVAGSFPGGPSWAYRLDSWLVVSVVPFGSNGPLTEANTVFLPSSFSACWTGPRFFHTEDFQTSRTWVGLATAGG